ncbi:MAG: HAMP domain-containing protein [Acidobacteria bacterium]|nr:HAMP domain-containing protein [Acidobacteriota bacterium]
MRGRIFFKLLLAFAAVIAAATLTVDLSLRRAWEDSLVHEIDRNLTQKTLLFAHRVDSDRQHSLADIAREEGQAAGARATVIDHQGRVLADSESQAQTMENQGRRREFMAALDGNIGKEMRRSERLKIPFLYTAAPIAGGAVRLAYPLSDVQAATQSVNRTLLLASALALLMALILAGIAAQSTASRLQKVVNFAHRVASGDLSARLQVASFDEIGLVARALDQTVHRMEENFALSQNRQRQLETLLNSMQDAVIAVDEQGYVQWANRGMDRLGPRTRMGLPLIETVRDPDVVRAITAAREQRRVEIARASSLVPGRNFDVTAAPMPGGGVVAVLRDLTETERVEKTRRDFIANVSHELRTPLTSIQGYAETLLDSTPASDHIHEFLDIIRKNAARMSRLTEDLLTLARVESGEQRFDVQPSPPGDLLHEVVESFGTVAQAQGVELLIENQADTAVSADREAIHQVFANLVDNALKYAGGGGRIALGARRMGNMVEFYVQDYGPGIPSEHLPRLFERFYRVDKARSRESGGTGLGLAIAKHIILAHGGSIRAESELNHGSQFLFTIPVASSAAAALS